MGQLKITLIILSLTLLIILTGCSQVNQQATTTEQTSSIQTTSIIPYGSLNFKDQCEKEGGTWKTFGGPLADVCTTGPGGGAAVITDSCDCGPDKCWYSDYPTTATHRCVPELSINEQKVHLGCTTDNDCVLLSKEKEMDTEFSCCSPRCYNIDYATDDVITINKGYLEYKGELAQEYYLTNCVPTGPKYSPYSCAAGACIDNLYNEDNFEAKCIDNICTKLPK